MALPRTIERLVEDQARRLDLRREPSRGRSQTPKVITISRLHGAGGEKLARRLSGELQLDLFDRELLRRIAETTHHSQHAVESLDDRERQPLAEWVLVFGGADYLSPAAYREHLERVVTLIARHGGVILGRGAHLILPPGEALRVLVVAPLADRIARIRQREGLDEAGARRRVGEVEAERGAFLRQHFHSELADPTRFDLVLNTAVLGIEGAEVAVRAGLDSLAARATR